MTDASLQHVTLHVNPWRHKPAAAAAARRFAHHGTTFAAERGEMARKSTRKARIQPSIRPTETYTESNFLRLYTTEPDHGGEERIVTLEHLLYSAGDGTKYGWVCRTIIDGEPMSTEDALFIARSYAVEHSVPVIYECHGD